MSTHRAFQRPPPRTAAESRSVTRTHLPERRQTMLRKMISDSAPLLLAGAAILWTAGPAAARGGGGHSGGGFHGGGGGFHGGGGFGGGGFHGGGGDFQGGGGFQGFNGRGFGPFQNDGIRRFHGGFTPSFDFPDLNRVSQPLVNGRRR